jgi:hypothetical protein
VNPKLFYARRALAEMFYVANRIDLARIVMRDDTQRRSGGSTATTFTENGVPVSDLSEMSDSDSVEDSHTFDGVPVFDLSEM